MTTQPPCRPCPSAVFPTRPPPEYASEFRRRLLSWYRRARRTLPWRDDRDAYRIWVSEVMLQQTQVATVVPYYRRFIARFPTAADLAAASEQDVLRAWEGLGYYRRAGNLHRAARLVVERHAGALPDDPAAIRSLPGIGRYMVGAILSQAYDRRLPILEANSRRALSRLFACPEPPGNGKANGWLWDAAERLLPRRGVGEFNQALMELGALVCTPRTPDCQRCPVAMLCAARAAGLQAQLPAKKPPPPPTYVHELAIVLRRGRQILLVQRPDGVRWAGLWEFPHAPLADGEPPSAARRRILQELTGFRGRFHQRLGSIEHAVTRFRITMACEELACLDGRFRSAFYRQARWLKPDQLADYPLSTPQRRLAARWLEKERQNEMI